MAFGGHGPNVPLGPPLPWRPLPNAPVPVHNCIYLPKTTKFVGYRRLNIVEPGDYIYTTLARDILLIIAGGSRREFRAVGLPKTQSGLFAPPPTVDWCEFVYSFRCFFYRYEYFHKSLALPDSLFLAFSFCSKFQNFLRDPNIFPKLDTDASRID